MQEPQAFKFVDGDRSYDCRLEGPAQGRPESWWWFTVSGDGNRYAPFRAAEEDTEVSVRTRVVAYYEERISRRDHWDRRPRFGQPRRGPTA